jgi:glycine cleavage system H lipoate-binding protein
VFADAWLIKVEIGNAGELKNLMDLAAYEKHCADNQH